jgi:iron(III) transport system substrate-binding protein
MLGPPLARPALAAAAVTLALCVAGCGGGAGGEEAADQRTLGGVAAGVDGLRGEEMTSKLAELAQDEEGPLSLYTSLTDELSDELAERFEQKFGIKVAVYAASADDIAQRMSEEASANHRGADLAEVNVPVLIALEREGLLADRVPVDTEGLDDKLLGPGWVAHEFIRFALSWNSKLVGDAHPRRWEDLADPRWDGKLGMELGDFDWYAGLRRYWSDHGKSEAEIDRLFGEIATGAKVIKGHSLTEQLEASGEISVAASNYSHLIDRAAKEGAPLTWKPVVEPAFLRPQGMGIAKGTTRPAGAALYIQWALTEVQDLYAADGWVPVRRAAASAPDFEQIVLDAKAITADEKRWSDEYDRLVRRGTLVPEG